MGIEAGEFKEERETLAASVPASFLTWIMAVSSPTAGLDKEEGSGKGEASCVFEGFGLFYMEKQCWGTTERGLLGTEWWWGPQVGSRAELLQPGSKARVQPNSTKGSGLRSLDNFMVMMLGQSQSWRQCVGQGPEQEKLQL